MNLKSNLQLIAEAAAVDNSLNIQANYDYDIVKETYSIIPEINESIVTEATDVVVTKTSTNDYFVEMVNLAPFMVDSGINNIAEALDVITAAYNLPPKSIGLVIESQARIDSILEAARKKAKDKKDPKILKRAIDKVNKNNAVAKKLMDNGYKVVKKNSSSKVCPKCGKVAGKCECQLNESGDLDKETDKMIKDMEKDAKKYENMNKSSSSSMNNNFKP